MGRLRHRCRRRHSRQQSPTASKPGVSRSTQSSSPERGRSCSSRWDCCVPSRRMFSTVCRRLSGMTCGLSSRGRGTLRRFPAQAPPPKHLPARPHTTNPLPRTSPGIRVGKSALSSWTKGGAAAESTATLTIPPRGRPKRSRNARGRRSAVSIWRRGGARMGCDALSTTRPASFNLQAPSTTRPASSNLRNTRKTGAAGLLCPLLRRQRSRSGPGGTCASST